MLLPTPGEQVGSLVFLLWELQRDTRSPTHQSQYSSVFLENRRTAKVCRLKSNSSRFSFSISCSNKKETSFFPINLNPMTSGNSVNLDQHHTGPGQAGGVKNA